VEARIFKAPTNRLIRYRTYVFKVVAVIPPHPSPRATQRAQAWEVLASQAQQAALTQFEQAFTRKWTARSTCGDTRLCTAPPSDQEGA